MPSPEQNERAERIERIEAEIEHCEAMRWQWAVFATSEARTMERAYRAAVAVAHYNDQLGDLTLELELAD